MTLRERLSHFRNAIRAVKLAYIPGHYFSPICNPAEIRLRYRDPKRGAAVNLPGIDLNTERQLERMESWREWIGEALLSPDKKPDRRYFYNTARCQYGIGDALPLYCFMRELRPPKVIEIGSGFSSALMLDVADSLSLETTFTFIDPSSDNLNELLRPADYQRATVLKMPVQDVRLDLFEALGPNDILFIDSSHVLKTCSDVAFELFEIMPRLKRGVFIHFHDIFFPFEYPSLWALDRNYSWNETYVLRALLMYQSKFCIEYWNDYLAKAKPDVVNSIAPGITKGASLWLSVDL